MIKRFSVGIMLWATLLVGHAGVLLAKSGELVQGAIGFSITLPPSRGEIGEPILSLGRPGNGEVVFCRTLADGRTVFGWHQSGNVAYFSDPIRVPQNEPVEMVVSLGNSYAPDTGETPTAAALRRLVLLQVQGRTVLLAKTAIKAMEGTIQMGSNAVGGPFAAVQFRGKISHLRPVSEAVAAAVAFSPSSLIAEASTSREKQEYPGPLVLQISMPSNATGRNEPLVVTGKTGAGDLLYIRYVDETHVQFGFDHWLVGGPLSEILPCDYAQIHDVTISMGSLLPPVSAARAESPSENALRKRCVVLFDGKRVMDWGTPFYPTREDEIVLGANPIGGSTADAFFNGVIRKVFRSKAEAISPVN